MQAIVEHLTPAPGASFRLHVRRERQFPFEWHCHPEYELTLITAGSGRRFVGDAIDPYRAGDVVLVGPNLPHTWQSESAGPSEAVVVQFRHDFLGPQVWQAPEFGEVANLLVRAGRGLAFEHGARRPLRALPSEPRVLSSELDRLAAETDPARRVVTLLDVLVTLAAAPARPLAGEGFSPRRNEPARRRVDAVCRFLTERYTEPVTLAETARVANLTPAAFCRFFRRMTSHTFTSYVTELRVSAARRQLIDTDDPVSTIAVNCGFNTLSHFNRVFRRLTGHSPGEFRRSFS